MPTVTLNEMDLRAFLAAFNAIAEVTDYTFDDETEYRQALANLVGDLKNQLPPSGREALAVAPRISLAALLEEKYVAWNNTCAGGSLCQSAASVVAEYLDKGNLDRGLAGGGDDPGEVIASLQAMVTAVSTESWNRYELALCAAGNDELERLTLTDMLEVLCATGETSGSGGSFWSRWTKK